MRPALLALLLAVTAAAPARATMFEGLFAFAERDGPAPLPDLRPEAPMAGALGPQSDAGVCIAAIRRAEAAHGIPADLLLAIGMQEAGMRRGGRMTVWPWTLNVEGRGVRFDSRAEAEDFLQGELAQGKRSIDVGCLQINLRWHPDAFPTPSDGFDPLRNADYAARFLRGLYHETGDWLQAAGRYHSATPELKDIYLAGLGRHMSRLKDGAEALDALAGPVGADHGTGDRVAVAAGVELDLPTFRRLNHLRAPVRQVTQAAGRGQYRRVLQPLPVRHQGADHPAADGGIVRTPGRDGLFP